MMQAGYDKWLKFLAPLVLLLAALAILVLTVSIR